MSQRDTGAPELLQSTLEQLRLEGAFFFRSELTEGFAFESTPCAVADALHPGAERLILFHIVARGSCWVATVDGDHQWAYEGDVIVLPYGDQHTIGGDIPAESVSVLTRSTTSFERSSVDHRSDTSPNGGCISRRNSSPPPTSAS